MARNLNDARRDFAKRLNEALDDAEYPPKHQGRQMALAKKLQVSQRGARRWLEGEAFPTHDKQQQLAKVLHVAFEWLSNGTGPKRPGVSVGIGVAEPSPPGLTPPEAAILDLYRSMDAETRRTWFKVGDALAASVQKTLKDQSH